MVIIVIFITILVLGFAFIAYLMYRRVLRRAKNIERGLKMVPLLIHLPPPSDDTQASGRDVREVMREKISQAEVLYNLIAGTATVGFKSNFYGQRHIALEIIATKGLIHFYAAVPVALEDVIKNAVVTAYPGARIEEAEDHNLFNPAGKLSGTSGGELVLKADASYPIATFDAIERDPIAALLNVLSTLGDGDGVGVQIMIRPASRNWVKAAAAIVNKKRKFGGGDASLAFGPKDVLKAAVTTPKPPGEQPAKQPLSSLEESVLKAIEEKTKSPGYDVLIRLVTSSNSAERSQAVLRQVTNTFSLFDAPGLNGFKFLPASDISGLVTAFALRFFPPELNQTILNGAELATIFHLPDAQFTPTSDVQRQASKQVDGPVSLPNSGLLMGYNFFRGTKKEIRLSPEDRRRHTYVVGQTGTGKSTLLENLAVQDMLAGNGFAFIDPHGDTAERLISMVPKNRSEDVIYFNPADAEFPLGLNIFEFSSPDQKDFLIQEAIGMLYKLYDPGHTGIIGPRYEHWFRNAALTLMSDPAGATFIEIPKVFTDSNYLKSKFQYLQDPTVIDFWTKEMAQTSDYHKSEMLGWFVSKFGAFQSNAIMRNIIGQPKSAFNLRDVMDNKKILIVNLSKGQIGELNSQLLGMILVIKFQAAAMSRASTDESLRNDFCLYVDEFQNFSTDSFASILSEARKYHLNLIVANQFIGQLSDQIRDAVFGNVGTIMSYRTGPEDAEFLVKQFAPVFDARDLVNLPNHNAVIRLMVGGLPSQPFSITALPPLGAANLELGAAVKQLSAAKFGIHKAQVEQEIFSRLSNKPALAAVPAPAPASAPVPVPEPAPAPVLATEPAAPAVIPQAASIQPPVEAAPAPIALPVQPPASLVQPQPLAPTTAPPPVSPPLPSPAPLARSAAATASTPNASNVLSIASIAPNLSAQPAATPAYELPEVPELGGFSTGPHAAPVASDLTGGLEPRPDTTPVPAKPVVMTPEPEPVKSFAKRIVDTSNAMPEPVSTEPTMNPKFVAQLDNPEPPKLSEDDIIFHVPVDPTEELAEYATSLPHESDLGLLSPIKPSIPPAPLAEPSPVVPVPKPTPPLPTPLPPRPSDALVVAPPAPGILDVSTPKPSQPQPQMSVNQSPNVVLPQTPAASLSGPPPHPEPPKIEAPKPMVQPAQLPVVTQPIQSKVDIKLPVPTPVSSPAPQVQPSPVPAPVIAERPLVAAPPVQPQQPKPEPKPIEATKPAMNANQTEVKPHELVIPRASEASRPAQPVAPAGSATAQPAVPKPAPAALPAAPQQPQQSQIKSEPRPEVRPVEQPKPPVMPQPAPALRPVEQPKPMQSRPAVAGSPDDSRPKIKLHPLPKIEPSFPHEPLVPPSPPSAPAQNVSQPSQAAKPAQTAPAQPAKASTTPPSSEPKPAGPPAKPALLPMTSLPPLANTSADKPKTTEVPKPSSEQTKAGDPAKLSSGRPKPESEKPEPKDEKSKETGDGSPTPLKTGTVILPPKTSDADADGKSAMGVGIDIGKSATGPEARPLIQPGEIYVDADGNVIQG